MHPVASSNIAAVGYDADAKTLRVQFSGGRIHEYPDVDAKDHQALVDAPSIGKHFHTNLRHRKNSRIE